MYDSARELIEALNATPDVLEFLLRGVSQVQAQQARGGDKMWSVVEVVCHLRDAEEFALERMRILSDVPNGTITGFDQEAWAIERSYATTDLREALTAFRRLRAEHLTELASLSHEQWEQVGRHIQHGPVTISNHTLHLVWHDAVHLAQLARQLTI